MKKKISMLLVVVMVMLMGMNAFAAQSPTTGTTDTPDSPASNYGNVSVSDVIVNGVVVSERPEVSPVNKSKVDEAQKEAESKVASTAKVLQIVDVDLSGDSFVQGVLDTVGVNLNEENYESLQMTFDVNGVVSGQKLTLLVQKADGTWVTVTPDKVENGKVTATFTFPFKTIAFVAHNASAQTGEMTSVLPVVMMGCVLAIAVCGKKVRYSK